MNPPNFSQSGQVTPPGLPDRRLPQVPCKIGRVVAGGQAVDFATIKRPIPQAVNTLLLSKVREFAVCLRTSMERNHDASH